MQAAIDILTSLQLLFEFNYYETLLAVLLLQQRFGWKCLLLLLKLSFKSLVLLE